MKAEGNILVLTQWSFKDALVQTYTLPYVEMIRQIIDANRKIFLVTSEHSKIALTATEIQVINESWNKKGMALLAQPYRRFGFRKLVGLIRDLWKIYRLVKKENIRTIHAVCTPAGGMAYILSVLSGANFIVDSYEPHAESMVENGTWKKNGFAYKLLIAFERLQSKKAMAVIGTTSGMKDYASDRFKINLKNFFVKPACVDLKKFYPRQKEPALVKNLQLEGKIVCVYAGKLGGIYFKEQVFDFIKACHDRWQDEFRFLMLTNASRSEIINECERTGLPENVVISRFVFHDEIPSYLSLGDFALNPVIPVPTKKYCTSIKDGEYWAMGLPVVISPNISDDSGIIEKEGIGVVMNFANKDEYERALNRMVDIMNNPDLKKSIREVGEQYRSFKIAENVYKEIYGE